VVTVQRFERWGQIREEALLHDRMSLIATPEFSRAS